MIFDKKRKETWDCMPEDVKHKLRCLAKGKGWTERRSYATIHNCELPLYNVLTDIFGTYWRLDEIPTDEIKVGDRVEVLYSSGNRCGMVCELKYDGAIDVDFGGGCIGHDILQERIRKLDYPKKQPDNTITIPVKVDLDDTYWDAYKAELASKIAVAYAEKGRFAPDEIGGFAVRVANDVVNNLKKQSE